MIHILKILRLFEKLFTIDSLWHTLHDIIKLYLPIRTPHANFPIVIFLYFKILVTLKAESLFYVFHINRNVNFSLWYPDPIYLLKCIENLTSSPWVLWVPHILPQSETNLFHVMLARSLCCYTYLFLEDINQTGRCLCCISGDLWKEIADCVLCIRKKHW